MLKRYLAAALILPLLAACSPSIGTVSGKVTFDGKPLPAGRITFLCEGGDKPALSSQIQEGGVYTIKDAPPGKAKITVETFPPKSFTPVPGMPANIAPPGEATGGPSGPAPAASGPYVAIPKRYSTTEASGLTYEIMAGEQTHDIALSP